MIARRSYGIGCGTDRSVIEGSFYGLGNRQGERVVTAVDEGDYPARAARGTDDSSGL